MPRLTHRVERMERRRSAGGCPRCFNGAMAIVRGDDALPPPCPRCGVACPVMRIPRLVPPNDWDTALKLAGLASRA